MNVQAIVEKTLCKTVEAQGAVWSAADCSYVVDYFTRLFETTKSSDAVEMEGDVEVLDVLRFGCVELADAKECGRKEDQTTKCHNFQRDTIKSAEKNASQSYCYAATKRGERTSQARGESAQHFFSNGGEAEQRQHYNNLLLLDFIPC